MDLAGLDSAKPIAALGALLLLLLAERRFPANAVGRAPLVHDLRNLSLGLLNALVGIALATWVLPSRAVASGGLLGALNVPGPAALVVGLLMLDLWMYAWHRMSHGLPWLWRVHRMHHFDPSMDASTALRFHPIETTLSALLRLPVGWVVGLGVVHIAVYEAILLPVILFHHSNLRVSGRLDRMLRWLVVTPALHRIHHSPERLETDSNFGSVLTWWDRLWRSLRTVPREPEPRFGLVGFAGRRWQSWLGMLASPFRSPGNDERRPPEGDRRP